MNDFLSFSDRGCRPLVITDLTASWPARDWTLLSLRERVGDNEVFIRGGTDKEDYKKGNKYTIRKDTFRK